MKIKQLDLFLNRIERRGQLFRGWIYRLRGANVGERFGIGSGVKILFPSFLTAGRDVMICDHCYLHCLSKDGVTLGDFSILDRGTYINCGGQPYDYSHGFVKIGNHSYIGVNGFLGAGGGITIGNHVLIGTQVIMHAENHRFIDADHLISEQGVAYKGILIEDDVWIGSNVSILDGAHIGKGCVIGASAVVKGEIPSYSIAVGVPARVIGQRRSENKT